MESGNYRRMEVWRKSVKLALVCYRATETFPVRERYGLVSQIRRAASSIPANIAEGHGRNHVGEFLQFVGVANGSIKELETHLILARGLGLISAATLNEILTETARIGQMLTRLRQSLRRKTS